MAGKRANGEGTVYKRKDGRYVTRVTLPSGARRSWYFVEREDATAKLRTVLTDIAGGRPPTRGDIPLRQHLERWLAETAHTVKPSHRVAREKNVRLHLVPQLGKVRLDRLTVLDVEAACRRLLASPSPRTGRPYSSTTVRQAHAVLRAALADAVRWGLVSRNVAAEARAPRVADFEPVVWSPDEAHRFLDAVVDDPLEALWIVALTTGMREGELLALRWEDVDLDRARLDIVQSVVRIPKQGAVFGTPKTAKSKARGTPLTQRAVVALRRRKSALPAMRVKAGPLWRDHGLVFCTAIGTPLHPSNLTARRFRPLCVKAKVPAIRFHDLRHSCASVLYALGADDRKVSELLRHSSVAFTHQRYIHVRERALDETVAILDRLLSGDANAESYPLSTQVPS